MPLDKKKGRDAALKLVDKVAAKQRDKAAEKESVIAPVATAASDLLEAVKVLTGSRPEAPEALIKAIEQIKLTTNVEPIDLTPLVKAVGGIPSADLSTVVKAIGNIKLESLDLSKIEKTVAGIESKLVEQNKILKEVVKAAKASKKVIYDEFGRVVEIKQM